MIKTVGYAAKKAKAKLHAMEFERAEPRADEILLEVLYCGVCHSDLHQVDDDWGNTIWPCLPGHEIIGRVTQAGSGVTRFKVGELAGVGCMLDSCGECAGCKEGLEQYCEGPKGPTMTYNGPVKPDGSNTFGGYSSALVVKETFALKIPDKLDPKKAAPILCAGVTTFSPLRHWKVGQGSKVGVVGLGGLGHMGTKLARAMGAQVSVLTTSKDKLDAARALGAHEVILSSDKDAMKQHALSFDFILDTIPEPHDINAYVSLLKRDGTLAAVGNIGPFKTPTNNQEVVFHRKSVAGSLIGGIRETQEVLDFCAEHDVSPDIELIAIDEINDAFKRMNKGDVRFRFVIDMATLRKDR